MFGETGGIIGTVINSSFSRTAVNSPKGTLSGIIYFYKFKISQEGFVAGETQKPVQI